MKTLKIFYLIFLVNVFLLFAVISQQGEQKKYFTPDFESLEKINPVPEWFKDAKFGIYLHWGPYTVPAFSNEWYPRNMYIPGSRENKHHIAKYGEISEWPYHYFILGAKDKNGNFVQFAPKLKSEGGNFDPDEWAQLFADAGARFAGMVAEHHDGFSMWASKVNPWNAKDRGPKLDLVGLLSNAILQKNLKLFLSLHHAYNITGYFEYVPKTNDPELQILYGQLGKEKNEALWLAKHKEIIDIYKPDILYQDFNLHRISQPVLLQFLAYYYNKSIEWNKEVVATFKDGLNSKCAVLDYERGGPSSLTDIYWLSDDAISPSSWCYTEGLTYYSAKQLIHSLIDKVSKNGNLILNISPKADGSIPQEQKDILYSIGNWLKKYGEAIYNTRAWEWYGEGPTKMGADHGVFLAPEEGTSKDIRYTRSKNNDILYAILLGWEKGQKEVKLTLLGSDRINLKNLKVVEFINGNKGTYEELSYKQAKDALVINLPEYYFEEPAYVIKLKFEGQIPPLNNYADINCSSYYLLIPGKSRKDIVLGYNLTLTKNKNLQENQWKFEHLGGGYYKIINRKNPKKVLNCDNNGNLVLSKNTNLENQLWKIENSYYGLLKISNKILPNRFLVYERDFSEGTKISLSNSLNNYGWLVEEVCEKEQRPFKNHIIPGIIEAEDFDTGCSGNAYYDKNDKNEGGQYRLSEGVDIEKCSTGGYNVGWISTGEWLTYTVNIQKSGFYNVKFYVASEYNGGKFHIEIDNKDVTGIIEVPNTRGFQNWEIISKKVKLNKGKHILKFYADGEYFNIDKMVFERVDIKQ